MSCIDDMKRIVSGRVAENEPMADHTSLGVGGPADIYIEAASESELCALMKFIHSAGVPWMVLGDGANVLVSDKGIRGVVVQLVGDFLEVKIDGLEVKAGAVCRISRVADIAAEHSLAGLQGVGDVPGSVGGAIVMNAGTHRGYIDEVTSSVSVVSHSGESLLLRREDCGFTYRNSRFQTDKSLIITFATFGLHPGDAGETRELLAGIRRHRADKEPRGRSAGCFFKNPPSGSAGKLIELAGGKGMREGGAVVSDVHANFIMNSGCATAADLYKLAELVRGLVRDTQGIELEYEVRLVGEW